MLTNIPRTEKASECGSNDFNQAKDFRPNGSFLFFILHDDFGFRVKLKVIRVRSARGWWLRGGSVVAPWWLRGGSEVARKSLGSRSEVAPCPGCTSTSAKVQIKVEQNKSWG